MVVPGAIRWVLFASAVVGGRLVVLMGVVSGGLMVSGDRVGNLVLGHLRCSLDG